MNKLNSERGSVVILRLEEAWVHPQGFASTLFQASWVCQIYLQALLHLFRSDSILSGFRCFHLPFFTVCKCRFPLGSYWQPHGFLWFRTLCKLVFWVFQMEAWCTRASTLRYCFDNCWLLTEANSSSSKARSGITLSANDDRWIFFYILIWLHVLVPRVIPQSTFTYCLVFLK